MFSVGTGDLASGLSQVLLGLVIFGFIASVVGIWAKKTGSTSVALDVAASLAFVWIVLSVGALLFVSWRALDGGNSLITTDLPLADSYFTDDNAADGPLPALVGAYASGSQLEIAGLPLGIRMMLLTTQVLNVALVIVPAIVIRVMAVRAGKGEPFAPQVTKTLWFSAIFVLVAGVVRDLVDPISQTLAARAVWTEGGPLTEPYTFNLTVQLWPFAAALVLAALAAVFRHGYKLQQDTKGLV